ncbi:peroxiredoxin family protein [Vampirovibrio chlorellavorus]|uniref:peroxiredoxin family protein n=1 Tax=Vampirovibrio chlorellavorus TaxID=758823 RepID=UPI0026F30504|nr:redoxin domain-containing protein [Vampirovibrio chlorellavorus]
MPDFALLDQQGHLVSLCDFTDQRGVVLLFFASDWLPGDVALLQGFRHAYGALTEAGLQVLALSSINWEMLFHLAKRLDLPFPLLFDQCCRQATFYQAAWIPKFVTGRAVYVLDNQQRVVFARSQASPEQVLAAFSG